jgi:transposase-like protein
LDSEVSSKKEAISRERKEVSEYIVDETVLKAGSENIWLWVATE